MKGFVALALGTALAARAGPAAAASRSTDANGGSSATAPSLAGKWTLNKEQSEDARQKMRDAGGGSGGHSGGGYGGHGGGMSGRGGFGGRGGGFGGRGGGGYGGQGGGGDAENAGRGGSLRSFFEPPDTLTITQTADEIAVDDGQRVLHLHPDGKKIKAENGGAETTTKWRGNELVVETRTERGTKIDSAYMSVPDKRQLFVTSTFEGRSGQPITVRRVYDAAGEAAPQ